jgi:hypothetical protein
MPKKSLQQVERVDTARENVKKQLLEAFDNLDEAIVNEIENLIFELTGKNSKDKSYREKAKKILSRLKGSRNSTIRGLIKKNIISVSDFCKMNDKQLDDDSYFDKFVKNGNPLPTDVKGRQSIKPPAFKSMPIQNIDVTANVSDAVNDYFNNLNEVNPIKEEKSPLDQVNSITNDELNERNDENVENVQLKQIIKENNIQIENKTIYDISDVVTQKNTLIKEEVFEQNQEIKAKIFIEEQKEIDISKNILINQAITDKPQVEEKLPKTSNVQSDKLKELKELMEKKKQAKGSLTTKPTQASLNNNFSHNPIEINQNELHVKDVKDNQSITNNISNLSNSNKDLFSVNPTKENPQNVNEDQLNLKTNIQLNTTKSIFDNENEVKNEIRETKKIEPQKLSNKNLFANPTIEEKPVIKVIQKFNEPQPPKVKSIFDRDDSEIKPVEPRYTESHHNHQKSINEVVTSDYLLTDPRDEITHNLIYDTINTVNDDANENKLNVSQTSRRSYFTYSNNKNKNDTSIFSIRDKYRNFNETKVSLETQLEMANKKCEIYEAELSTLRKSVNEIRNSYSKSNEESYKLEISRMKQNIIQKEKENEILLKENQTLKFQLKKYEENTESIRDEGKKFRIEAEKKFAQYNKEIEALNIKIQNLMTLNISTLNNTQNVQFSREEEKQVKYADNEINFNYTNSYNNNYGNDFIRDNRDIKKPQEPINTYIENSNEINYNNHEAHSYNNNFKDFQNYESNTELYDHNNFTNGNPNIVEEDASSENYHKMNGNTYDEMKDQKEEDDIAQSQQLFENENHEENVISQQVKSVKETPLAITKNIFSETKKEEFVSSNNIFASKFI